jgi:hypothetical protein
MLYGISRMGWPPSDKKCVGLGSKENTVGTPKRLKRMVLRKAPADFDAHRQIRIFDGLTAFPVLAMRIKNQFGRTAFHHVR